MSIRKFQKVLVYIAKSMGYVGFMQQTSYEKLESKRFYARVDAWTAEKWVSAIEAIPDELTRNRVAAIVWWDMSQRRQDLGAVKAMIEQWRLAPDPLKMCPDQLADGLRKVGYPEHMITERSRVRCKRAPGAKRKKVTKRNGKSFLTTEREE